ncbi:MAG: carbohydrate kinase family protein [Fimbriimonadaceae bacterium]|nr:carbohydrate kinase family protein [Fimbriimonadaceae bacterium]
MLLASRHSGRFGGLILVYGTICIDQMRTIKQLPPSGGYVEILEERILLGGEAANTAYALMQWDADMRLAGNPLGLDADGRQLADLVRKSGLPMQDLQERDATTPVCDIYVTPNGERTMFGKGFATITDSLDPPSAPFAAEGWFTLDSNLRESGDDALRLAKGAGMHLYVMDILDPSIEFAATDVWQCSTDWAGVRGDVAGNLEWVRRWGDRHGCAAILTDGSNGFVAGGPGQAPKHFFPYPCPKVVDSTGAGDMFRAGMLFGLDQGWPFSQCLSFAAAAGSLKCQALGAMTYVPTLDEVQAHISAHPDVAEQYI